MNPDRALPQIKPLAFSIILALSAPAWAADPGSETVLPEVKVTVAPRAEAPSEKTGAYTKRKTSSATRLELSQRETPQSVSVLTRAVMDDFKLNSVNEMLDQVAGVNVDRVETDRTYYTARGFDINNFQLDGVGVPFTFGNVMGDMDTWLYDSVEVVRGANGLISPTGNPSATINFIRKRPTYDFQAKGSVTFGSWSTRRINGDVSGPVNEAGTLRARVVAAQEQGDSYLDRYSKEKTVFSAIVEADLSDSTLLTLGHSQQRNRSKGAMWGALPLYNTDGTPTNYDVSTSTAADWTYWNTQRDSTFAELSQRFSNGWQAKAAFTFNKSTTDSKLFYVYGTPDSSTGLGLYSYPSLYAGKDIQKLADVQASGPFMLAGRQHELSVGAHWSNSRLNDVSHYGQGIGTALPSLASWTGNYPEPAFNASVDGSAFETTIKNVYASSRLNVRDDVKLIAGVSVTKAESLGPAYGVSHTSTGEKAALNAGLIYELSPALSSYASYTQIYRPQYEIDVTGKALAPATGENYELGLKGEFLNKQLNTAAVLFRTRQNNLATSAGYTADWKTYYAGVDTESQGIELEAAGKLTDQWQASTSYTRLSIQDGGGAQARTFTPRQLMKVATTYQLFGKVKLGGNLKWQSDIYRNEAGGVVIRQGGYALLGLMASYDFSKNVSASANLNNVANKKYLNSLYWSQAYYGAPRNGSLTVSWKY